MIPLSRNIRLGAVFLGAMALITLNTWLINRNFNVLAEHEFWQTHTSEVEAKIEQVMLATLDSASGVRGYLLSGSENYLDSYHQSVSKLYSSIEVVRDATIDNPVETRNSDELKKFADILKNFLDGVARSKQAHSLSVAELQNFLEYSKPKTDAIRDQLSKMHDHEESLMVKRTDAVNQSKEYFRFSLFFAALLNALFIFVAFIFVRRNYDTISRESEKNAYDSKVKEEMNTLSRSVSGEITARDVANRSLEFLATHFQILASHLYAYDVGGIRKVGAYGLGQDDDEGPAVTALVSEALKRGKPWVIREVPEGYWQIRSGLGSSKPRSLVFVPIRFQDQNFAVLELGAFNDISDDQVERIMKLAELIGISFNAAQSRDRLQELLERTQQQSEELQLQQEELRSNNEELEQQAHALEEQQSNLAAKNLDLEEVKRQLELKAVDLENSSKYKSEFLAKMSHELRTPLNSLLILSTLLMENKEANLTDRQRQFATSIHSSGQDLLMLINDILDLSKIEAKKLRLKIDAFPVNSILVAKEASFSIQAKSKGISFLIDATEEVKGEILKTDRQRLEQILRNFISNAIKFTEKGSITLRVRMADAERVKFSIVDTGIGIPDDKIDLIFEAFEQADGSVSRKYGGTGLGLTISKELAGLLEGSIDVKSVVGQGSEFSITIPLTLTAIDGVSSAAEKASHSVIESSMKRQQIKRPTNERAEQYHEEALKVTKDFDPTKKSILVIEDDDRFRMSVIEAIRGYGFQAIECGSGELALEILNMIVPSAILLDIKLPEVSGFVLLEHIKGRADLRHVPVHIISGLEYQHNALRMGAMGYLTKPVTIEKVTAALERIKGLISGDKRRILLIEDDETQSEAISQIIAGEDLEVVKARSGKEAISQLQSGAFDCIILDLKLSDTSGFKLLEEFNQLSVSVPPVVIYTGKDLTIEEEEYLRRFSESIIIKGARSPERLLDEVNLFLHRVESLLPQDKKNILKELRSNEKVFEGRTVLVVDDDLRNIFSLTSALENKGITVRIAKDGIEALDVLEKNKDIDLVLMDIMMPRMDGYEATKRIRESQDPHTRNLPIVALTAKAMKGDYEKCIAAGANDYLPKPVNLENFNTILKVWLSRKGV